jgi:hypothetical protein
MLTERISLLVALAVEAHDKQVRKGTRIPYVAHPMGVASLALDFGADEDQAIAALLHDVLEDGGPQFAPVIGERFGRRVLALVEGCTDGVPDATGGRPRGLAVRRLTWLTRAGGRRCLAGVGRGQASQRASHSG